MARSPVLQIPNAAQLTLFWICAGQLAENVLGCSHTGGVVFDQALAEALGSSIKAAFQTNLGSHFPAVVALARVGIRSLSSPNLPIWRDSGALSSGTAVGDCLPPNVAQCVTLRTARSGKSYRGRTFLSGFAESDSDTNGHQSSASSAAGVAFINAVNTALQARSLRLAVLSRPAYEQTLVETTIIPGSDNIVRLLSHSTPKAGSFENVTVVESRNLLWESQRRRNNGVGVPPTFFDAVHTIHLEPAPV
jgi:hypothetical protein